MKHMKKFIALALVAMTVLAVALPAFAADWTWRYGTEVDANSGTSANVRNVQTDLNSYFGYTRLKVDGYWGPKTEAAVIDFQQANGLDPDGVVGPLTMEKLYDVYLSH